MKANACTLAWRFVAALFLAVLLFGPGAERAAAKGAGTMAAPGGVEATGSPHRYYALDPRMAGAPTVIQRIDGRRGRIDRWWYLPGDYFVPAVAYDGSGGGLSADGSTLVLGRLKHEYPARETRFAVLDTEMRLRHPYRPRRERSERAIRRIDLPGAFSFHAISPDGSIAYLTEFVAPKKSIAEFEVRALDLETGELRSEPLPETGRRPRWMKGLPITRADSRDGRWAYTLYDGYGGVPFLLALDTVAGETFWIDLPQLKERHELYLIELDLIDGGRYLVLANGSPAHGLPPPPRLFVDTRNFAVRYPAEAHRSFLDFARTPRRPGNLLSRRGVVGRSAEGRPISLQQHGDPTWSGELLVFGCIHGDECAARAIEPLTALSAGCPDPSADIHLVPNLNPDGARVGSRLNGRGVDLNRNFPSEWRPFGRPWDLEYAGPEPSSEPETRLAERIIRGLRPEVTIWFHQFWGKRPFVRAWGRSTAAGRRFARLARMPFRAMRWPAGTAPNWQNHRFPGAASFVVELPRGPLAKAMRERLGKAVVRMGRQVRED